MGNSHPSPRLPRRDHVALAEHHRPREREAFIAAWQEGEETVAALAHHFGVSRKTAHKFINRFRAAGADGLLDRSRAPRCAPQRHTPGGSSQTRGALGPKKLSRLSPPPLARSQHRGSHPRSGRSRPSSEASAPHGPVARPLQAVHPRLVHRLQGLGPHRRRRPHRPPHHPGRPFPLPARLSGAAPSRLPPGPSRLPPGPSFERTFREYGLPLVIRSDNGPPFASTALGGCSPSGSSSSASSRSASSPDTPNRTAASSGSTAP